MRLTESHDVSFCQAILLTKADQFKSGSKESGASWKIVSEDPNTITKLNFSTTRKSVRERYCPLIEKQTNKKNAMKLIHQGLTLKREKLIYYCKILQKNLKCLFSNISQKATKSKNS